MPHLPPCHPRQLVRGQGPDADVPPPGNNPTFGPQHSYSIQQAKKSFKNWNVYFCVGRKMQVGLEKLQVGMAIFFNFITISFYTHLTFFLWLLEPLYNLVCVDSVTVLSRMPTTLSWIFSRVVGKSSNYQGGLFTFSIGNRVKGNYLYVQTKKLHFFYFNVLGKVTLNDYYKHCKKLFKSEYLPN